MENKQNYTILLKNVRISYASVWVRSEYNRVEGKYEATFLIPKSDTETKNKISAIIERVKADRKLKVARDKICLKDGDDTGAEEYEGHWTIKASNNIQPMLMDTDKTILADGKKKFTREEEEELEPKRKNKIYSGCRVNVYIEFWGQDNIYGKRINANLLAIQHFEDDTPFGTRGGSVDPTQYFDIVPSAPVDTSAADELPDEMPF